MAAVRDGSDGAFLECAIQDLQERVNQLKLFDRQGEIYALCDDLEAELQLVTESITKDVRQAREEMLAKVKSYRADLMHSTGDSMELDEEDEPEWEPDLNTLMIKIERLGRKHSTNFEQPSVDPTVFKACEIQMKKYSKCVEELKRKMRAETFTGGFLTLIEGESFSCSGDFYASLITSGIDVEDETTMKHYNLSENVGKASVIPVNPDSLESMGGIRDILFLFDGTLALSLANRTVLIFNPVSKKIIHRLASPYDDDDVIQLVQLSSGHLVTGSSNGRFSTWDPIDQEWVSHVDLCFDYRDESDDSDFSPASVRDGKVKLWSQSCGNLIERDVLPRQSKRHTECKILSNGEVAYCFKDRTIEFYDLTSQRRTKSLSQPHHHLAKIIDADHLVVFVYFQNESTRKISVNGREFTIRSYAVSPDGKFLATGCADDVLILWPLS